MYDLDFVVVLLMSGAAFGLAFGMARACLAGVMRLLELHNSSR